MKKTIILLLWSISWAVMAQPDLPPPTGSTQQIPAGSFLVPMDNNYQSIVPAGQAPFNLKAYGLVNEFLQQGIPVKWAIKTGKQPDGIDLSASVERIAPSAIAASTLDFRAGPFIVPDTSLPCGLSTREIIQRFGNNVAVYKINAPVSVEIRYTLVHRPKVAVFNNGGNQVIHTKILDAAGIGNYDVMDAADIDDLINCYTFVSEPHCDDERVSTEVIDAVRKFVMNGGNFLAQCHAIAPYENKALFLSTAGIEVLNNTVSHTYPHPDLAINQIHGPLNENEGGSIHNWSLAAGSSWRSFTYNAVTDQDPSVVVAIGGHLISPNAPGGNVYYLGGHDYDKGKVSLGELARVNGLRMYLNGIFVPSKNSNGAWANAGTDGTVGCNDSLRLGCDPTGPLGSTFAWTPSTGLSCTSCPNPIAKPTVTTKYIVQVTNGCVARDTVTVVVQPKYEAKFVGTAGCQGEALQFVDQSPNATFRQWNFGDPDSGPQNASSLSNPSHAFSKPGTFQVTLISGIPPLCLDTVVQPVTIYPLPVVQFDPSGTGCPPVTVQFSESSSVPGGTIQSWLWNFGDPTSPDNTSTLKSPSHVYQKSGAYDITLSVVSDKGCKASLLLPKRINVAEAPLLYLGMPKKVCTESSESLVLDAGVWSRYRWKPTGDTTQTIVVKNPGTYWVEVSNVQGCSATSSIEVKNACPPRVFVSNSFTPNGDGVNDHYEIFSAHIDQFEMYIFNRWGEIIFESKDKTHVWDGVYKGEPMPIGVYPWIITYTGSATEYYGPYRLKGSVTVVR